MRNYEFLDNQRPEDSKIGELFYEDGSPYRMVDGEKISQVEEKTQWDKDFNITVNRIVASGLSPFEYLKEISNTQ